MSNVEIGAGGRLSLAQRLAQGRIPAGGALRYASLLAESLRRAHDEGRVHGFLTPSVVWLNGPAVELAPPPAGPRTLTPYTAPELLLGKPADSRGDIFSFGAILYEMLTGRRAFAGDTQAALANALKSGQPASTGSPAADKLLTGCLAKDPAGRWQQIQKVILELKLLAVAARRAEGARRPPVRAAAPPLAESTAPIFQPPAEEHAAPPLFQAPAAPCFAPPEPEPAASVFQAPPAQPLFQAPLPPPPDFSAIRGEMQQSESRLATRLQLGEKAMAVLNRAVVDALTGLRSQISTLTAQMAAMQDRANLGLQGGGDAAVSEAALARIEQTLQAFGTRMEVIEKGIGVLQDRVARTELEAEAAKQQVGVLQSSIAEDLVAFKQSLQKQERAVDSARTAMAQTDDLVERLVEALEALQATVLQRSEEWTASVN
ncbi:MAG: protein kinase domain-containing protein [Bryobacteraceae bacterium]